MNPLQRFVEWLGRQLGVPADARGCHTPVESAGGGANHDDPPPSPPWAEPSITALVEANKPLPRSCYNANGTKKKAYTTFDKAQGAVIKTRDKVMKAYSCPEHGWHLAKNPARRKDSAAAAKRRPVPKKAGVRRRQVNTVTRKKKARKKT